MEQRLQVAAAMRARSLGYAIVSLLTLTTATGCKRGGGVVHDAQASSPAPARPTERANRKGGDDRRNDRWRDVTVYIDGAAAGVLSFGELPIALKPIASDERGAIESRRYRFRDLLQALGVDLAHVSQIQIMGVRPADVIVASGAELRAPAADAFQFRYDGGIEGKPVAMAPPRFGQGVAPETIAAVAVYVAKKPPSLIADKGLVLDGKPVVGIPYYGEPLRGGVRVYVDDRLALQIKKRLLHDSEPATVVDGLPRYRLWDFLAEHGVDTSKIVEGWVIADQRRSRKLTRAELGAVTLAMGDNHQNELFVGGEKNLAQAIALHSRALAPGELPRVRPDDKD